MTGKVSAIYWSVGAVSHVIVAIAVQSHMPWIAICVTVAVLMAIISVVVPWEQKSPMWLVSTVYVGVLVNATVTIDSGMAGNAVLLFPISILFADVFWNRKAVLAAHLIVVYAVFIGTSLAAGGSGEAERVLIETPFMLGSALLIGFAENRFVSLALRRRRFSATIKSLVSALQARDGYTADHSRQTLAIVMGAAESLGMSGKQRRELADIALLHDVGKIGIPNEILNKPGKLSEAEWELMREHPVIGERILAGVPGFEQAARAIRHEHERWDGNGYPDGLKGEAIPLASRIVLACDAYHAMTSDRPYRKAMSAADARAELTKHSGTQFDPRVVDALLVSLDQCAVTAEVDQEAEQTSAADRVYELDIAQDLAAGTATNLEPVTSEHSDEDWYGLKGRLGMAAWIGSAVVATAYISVFPGFNLVGICLVAACCAAGVGSLVLPESNCPRSVLVAGMMIAIAVVTGATFYYDQPAVVMFALLPAAQFAMFTRNRLVLLAQGAVVTVLFTVVPLLVAGSGELVRMPLTAASFPATVVIVGFLGSFVGRLEFDRQRFTSTIGSLLRALEARDGYTADHSEATLSLALNVAEQLSLDSHERSQLVDVALLHDVGKIGIPNEILNKPGKLSDDEWQVMREHPAIGQRIIAQIPGFEQVAIAIRHEHERWDGGGYPDGLAGPTIPLASRIVMACDAYHAMTSDRPYRRSIGEAAACAELKLHAGTQFDPDVVRALLLTLASPTDASVVNRMRESDGHVSAVA